MSKNSIFETSSDDDMILSSASSEGPDLLGRYLQSLRSIPLLTREQERELSSQIRRGQSAESTLQSALLLTSKQRKQLLRQIEKGQAAFEQLVQANLRLVVTIARRWKRPETSLLDVIQEGNLGLMRAAELYDGQRNIKFSDFAGLWICFLIRSSKYSQPGGMGYPSGVHQRIAKMRKAVQEFVNENGRDPAGPELAKCMGVPVRTVWQLQMAAWRPVPLDAPANGQEEGPVLAERVSSADALSARDQVERNRLSDLLTKAVSKLSAEEQAVINLAFGLKSGIALTRAEICSELGISEKLLHTLWSGAMRKLRRRSPIRRVLAEFLR